MGRTCTICTHDLHHEINVELVSPKRSFRHIASRYGVSTGALQRHAKEDLPELLVQSTRAVEVARADDLIGNIERMIDRLDAFIDEAEADKDGPEFRANVAEWRKQIELLARIAGQLQDQQQINIFVNPQWMQIERALVQSLARYPDARRDVMAALQEVSSNGGS